MTRMNSQRLTAIGYSLLFIGLLFAPALGAYPVFVMKLMCFALFASAFNLLLGYTGMLSFGHAAFLGGAAYAAGHSMKVWGFTPEVGLLLGTASGALLGLVVGFFAIRREGIYSTMITLALAQMLYFVFLQMPFTGGEDGLQGVPRGKLFGLLDLQSDLVMYYVVLAVVVAAFLLIVRTIHSPYGQVLKAIKENEARAISLGYDTNRFKLLVCAVCGLVGLGRFAQNAGAGFCYLERRALVGLGPRGVDDLGRRPGHFVGPAGRLGHRGAARKQNWRLGRAAGPPLRHRVVPLAG